MRNPITRLLPEQFRRSLRKAFYAPQDLYDLLRGKRKGIVPPRRMVKTIGGGDFETVGKEFLKLLIDVGGLKPTDRVLDVGCGVGRMAIPLTGYLTESARYDGFDIIQEEILWCQQNITPRFPNFHFEFADIRNALYNPSGAYMGSDYKFPFPDRSFDFVFLTSVFTHLLPGDLEHYLQEISRVMKPGAQSFITYFLLNAESDRLISDGKSTLDFRYDLGECRTTDTAAPENAVAYDETRIVDLYRRMNLSVEHPIRYGSWAGRKEYLSYQDIALAVKRK